MSLTHTCYCNHASACDSSLWACTVWMHARWHLRCYRTPEKQNVQGNKMLQESCPDCVGMREHLCLASLRSAASCSARAAASRACRCAPSLAASSCARICSIAAPWSRSAAALAATMSASCCRCWLRSATAASRPLRADLLCIWSLACASEVLSCFFDGVSGQAADMSVCAASGMHETTADQPQAQG